MVPYSFSRAIEISSMSFLVLYLIARSNSPFEMVSETNEDSHTHHKSRDLSEMFLYQIQKDFIIMKNDFPI